MEACELLGERIIPSQENQWKLIEQVVDDWTSCSTFWFPHLPSFLYRTWKLKRENNWGFMNPIVLLEIWCCLSSGSIRLCKLKVNSHRNRHSLSSITISQDQWAPRQTFAHKHKKQQPCLQCPCSWLIETCRGMDDTEQKRGPAAPSRLFPFSSNNIRSNSVLA